MRHLVEVRAGEFEHLRLGLHRHHAKAQHVAEIAQAAEVDRSDTARPAGDEAADRRGMVGRGVHAQLLRRMRTRRLVDVGNDGAGLAHDPAGRDRFHRVHFRKRQHDAARKRHGLAVIARPVPRGVTGMPSLWQAARTWMTSASFFGETMRSPFTSSRWRLRTGLYQ